MMSLLSLFVTIATWAQVTTSSLSGVVKNQKGENLAGASVQAVHQPTGTSYKAFSSKTGVYNIPAVKPGGPYTITVTFVGYKQEVASNLETSLGMTLNQDFELQEASLQLKEVTIVGNKNSIMSKDRTGAAQQFSKNQLQTMPITGARTIDGITKYNPMGDGRSFGAQDSRLNNFTIDGSQFNNNFGLGSSAQAGGRTGASAIS